MDNWKDFIYDYSNTYEWMERINKQNPLIICLAVNGGVQGKETHPMLPETPAEIAQSVYEAYNAGAAAVHIHGRNPECLWDCTDRSEVYLEINSRIREKCPDIIINNTTGGGMNTTMEARLSCLDAKPEIASLNMGPDMSKFKLPARPDSFVHPRSELEINTCLPFTYKIINDLAQKMADNDIKPELEMYHPGQYWVSRELIKAGLIKAPYLFQFVMGYQTSIFPTPANLIEIVRELPKDSLFSVAGIGKFQWHMIALSILLGGNIRVGLEDNIYLKRGIKLDNNAHAVEKAVTIARELNRDIASPMQARSILGLSKTPRRY